MLPLRLLSPCSANSGRKKRGRAGELEPKPPMDTPRWFLSSTQLGSAVLTWTHLRWADLHGTALWGSAQLDCAELSLAEQGRLRCAGIAISSASPASGGQGRARAAPGPRPGRSWAATRTCGALPAVATPRAAWAPRWALPRRRAERRLALLRGRAAGLGAPADDGVAARAAPAFSLFEYSHAI